MKSEIHKHRFKERKDAARMTKCEMCYHERSPGGRGKIVKPKRGTPSKLEIRKIFETDASLPAGGYTELLSQSSIGLNPLNPGCTRLDMKIV